MYTSLSLLDTQGSLEKGPKSKELDVVYKYKEISSGSIQESAHVNSILLRQHAGKLCKTIPDKIQVLTLGKGKTISSMRYRLLR